MSTMYKDLPTLYKEEFSYGFCLELRKTALLDKPFAVEFFSTNTFTKSNYFSTYEEALQFFDHKVLEIRQALDCFLKVDVYTDIIEDAL